MNLKFDTRDVTLMALTAVVTAVLTVVVAPPLRGQAAWWPWSWSMMGTMPSTSSSSAFSSMWYMSSSTSSKSSSSFPYAYACDNVTLGKCCLTFGDAAMTQCQCINGSLTNGATGVWVGAGSCPTTAPAMGDTGTFGGTVGGVVGGAGGQASSQGLSSMWYVSSSSSKSSSSSSYVCNGNDPLGNCCFGNGTWGVMTSCQCVTGVFSGGAPGVWNGSAACPTLWAGTTSSAVGAGVTGVTGAGTFGGTVGGAAWQAPAAQLPLCDQTACRCN